MIIDQMDADNPRTITVPVADHLARWAKDTRSVDEKMYRDHIHISGNLAQVWGPYTFWVEGEITHCGINSLSLVKTDGEWKVGNTSFTMVPPDQCADIDAPGRPE